MIVCFSVVVVLNDGSNDDDGNDNDDDDDCYMVQIVLPKASSYTSCMPYILLLVSFHDAIFCL